MSDLIRNIIAGDFEEVKRLLESGCDPNDYIDLSPLGWAIKLKQEEITRLLLENGADPNGRDSRASPLLISLMGDSSWHPLFKMVLEAGGDPLAKSDGRTSLMLACMFGNHRAVKTLLDDGRVDPKSQDQAGWTALMFAAHEGRVRSVADLLPVSDLNAKTAFMDDALSIARQSTKPIIQAWLEKETFNAETNVPADKKVKKKL